MSVGQAVWVAGRMAGRLIGYVCGWQDGWQAVRLDVWLAV
jgi:hypothetical protein